MEIGREISERRSTTRHTPTLLADSFSASLAADSGASFFVLPPKISKIHIHIKKLNVF